jgi:Peptidase family M1 domain
MLYPDRSPALRSVFCALVIALCGASVPAAQLPEASPKTLHYAMDVQLLDGGHLIRGSERVTWYNQTEAATDELWWHVYNNAFRGRDSVWLKEANQYEYDRGRLPKQYGGTDIESVKLMEIGGVSLAPQDLEWQWVPQPGAPNDRTVMKVQLPETVKPGEKVVVHLEFRARMIPAYRRNGWGSDGYLHAAQWYPKMGVFEQIDGQYQWNCPPYHMLVEFYSDYADFRVDLTVPEQYHGHLVASGEMLNDPQELPDQAHWRYSFQALDVHDFAWTGDPEALLLEKDFIESEWRDVAEEQKIASALGRPVEQVRPDGAVRMYLLLQPEHQHLAERYFNTLAKSLYYFGLWYGQYPYATISVVDPANDARHTGGMEYPRLITAGANLGAAERSHNPEGVTVHEFGHQYWYALVGNNEFEHAWMDEGFCTFSTQRVLAKAFQPQLATYPLLGQQRYGKAPLAWPTTRNKDLRSMLTLTRWESPSVSAVPAISQEIWRPNSLTRYLAELPPVSYWPEVVDHPVLGERRIYRTDFYQPMNTPSVDLFEWSLRGVNTYYRPAMTLETMARLMGEDRWIRLIRAYHERFRFQHPRPEDWFEVVREFATGATLGGPDGIPIDWNSFWNQAYRGSQTVDFGVHRLVNLPHLQSDPDNDSRVRETEGKWDVRVEIRRLGEFVVPVEIDVHWSDHMSTRYYWNGQDPTWTLAVPGSERKALQVVIDPDRKLILDRNWLNNSRTVDPNDDFARQAGVRALLWAQSMLHFFGGIG